jgi:L-aminopeptidase/D-esterase-like protein
VGKLFELPRASKGGLGTASVRGGGDVMVGALVVVNALGDIIDHETGDLLAGLRSNDKSLQLVRTTDLLRQGIEKTKLGRAAISNTTLAVVATNVALVKEEVIKVAQMAGNGLARTISPVNTTFDGDVTFALSTGAIEAHVNNVGTLAEHALMEAVKRAAIYADGFGIVPAYTDILRGTAPA